MTGPVSERTETEHRAQASLLGLVLLIGIVSVSIIGVLLVGSAAMNELEGSIGVQNAEHAMREVDVRLSQVAFSANDAHTLDFTGQNGNVEVTSNGKMIISMAGGSNQSCREEIAFGSIHYRGKNGATVAYQAGGVWKKTEGGSVMLSPPDMQYRNGTFSLQMVNVTGSASGSVRKLRASKDVTASRAASKEFREAFQGCNPPENATLTVQSNYYEAWADFFRSHVETGSVTTDHGNETVTMSIVMSGATTSGGNQSIKVDHDATVTTELLSTEISGTTTDTVCTDWSWWGCEDYETIYYKLNAPINMRVNVGDETYRPWGDVNGTGTAIEKDVNDPTDDGTYLDGPTASSEYRTFTANVSAGENISVGATGYEIQGYDKDAYTEIALNGYTWRSVRTTDAGDVTANIVVDADGSDGQNEGNVVVLADGDEVPNYGSANVEQRNMSQVLGHRMNESGYLRLDQNEFVLVYELSCSNVTTADIGTSTCGSGDPDYNDAVVLVTIEETGRVGAAENFRFHVTMNQVRVESKSS
ncbi:DUF7289 family protein [Halomicrococcus gelatinilyticus]|uniref:DUF7289 family protein n=1 Tax=Halomicrococcus gelatinilyticus TaxID=1702103 RepID=UPI002E130876